MEPSKNLPKTKKKDDFHWTDFDKQRAVAAYSVTGSFSKAAAVTGIPDRTIRYWARQDWFADELKRADQAETEELKSVYTRIAKRAAIELEDRLEHGDSVLNKEGEVIQKPVAARDLAIITGVAADQRRKQMDAPVVVAVQSSDQKLLDLMEKFVKFAKAKELKGQVVNVQEQNEITVEAIPDRSGVGSDESEGDSPADDSPEGDSSPTDGTGA